MSNAVCQKYQDVLLHPVTFCTIQASLLFWLFWPTILCTVKDTSHRLSHERAQMSLVAGVLISEITCSMSKFYAYCIWQYILCKGSWYVLKVKRKSMQYGTQPLTLPPRPPPSLLLLPLRHIVFCALHKSKCWFWYSSSQYAPVLNRDLMLPIALVVPVCLSLFCHGYPANAG